MQRLLKRRNGDVSVAPYFVAGFLNSFVDSKESLRPAIEFTAAKKSYKTNILDQHDHGRHSRRALTMRVATTLAPMKWFGHLSRLQLSAAIYATQTSFNTMLLRVTWT